MTVEEVGKDLVALCQVGKFEDAVTRYYSPDIVSIEAMGEEKETKGLEAVAAKGEWWAENHDVHSIEVEGPFVNGDQFTAIMRLDVTFKPENKRHVMNEVCLYNVENGKIVREVFFY